MASPDDRTPLTVGVTGHRDLVDGDLVLYRTCIEALFDDLRRRYPDTPLRVLSALAEGADRLPIEIALARGDQVAVVLPLPVAEYERDFGPRVEPFRALLARIPADRVFTMPPMDSPAHRDTHYERAGHHVATHCHLLLALWDGVANERAGGTAEIVRFMLNGSVARPLDAEDPSAASDGGPVAWLRARRASAPTADTTIGTLGWLYPRALSEAQFHAACSRIDADNRGKEPRP